MSTKHVKPSSAAPKHSYRHFLKRIAAISSTNSGKIIDLFQSRFLARGCDEALLSKKGVFSEKGGGNSVNQGFGKDFYRKGNSVKRSGRFSEPPNSAK